MGYVFDSNVECCEEIKRRRDEELAREIVICDELYRTDYLIASAFIGWPDYHVKGSKKVYCGFCDTPPVFDGLNWRRIK